jgi:hypothetical protein
VGGREIEDLARLLGLRGFGKVLLFPLPFDDLHQGFAVPVSSARSVVAAMLAA